MIIGMTYDLKDDYLAAGLSEEEAAEFDSIETIDSIHAALEANGHTVERVGNIKSLVMALAAGRRWNMVFNICEGLKGIGREAQVPALLDAYDIPYVFSPPEVMVTTMDKSLAKLIAREAGVPTADFAVVQKEEDIDRVKIPFPLFVKPLAEGTSKGVSAASVIRSQKDLEKACLGIISNFRQPALVESFLPGREFTVGIVGTGCGAQVVGVLEIRMQEDAEEGCYSYYNKVACKEVFVKGDDQAAEEAGRIALQAWKALACTDGGRVDVRLDENGVPHFIEVNPLAGLRPGYSEFPILAEMHGWSYERLIGSIVDMAAARSGSRERFIEKLKVAS